MAALVRRGHTKAYPTRRLKLGLGWDFRVHSMNRSPQKTYFWRPGRRASYKIHDSAVAVGTALAGGPPHRSVRAALPHTAPTSG
jgi:hypothetical protein